MNRKLREAGFEARGLDEAAICQVAHDQTDGFIGEQTVEMLAAAHRCKNWRKLVAILVTVGRWVPNPDKDGWDIHDYLEYNPSKADWEAEKEKKRAAGKRGGQASAQARASASGQADASAGVQANAQADPTRPDPTPVTNPPPPLTVVRAASPEAAKVLNRVVEAVAERQLAAATNVRNPSGWLVSARMSILREWRDYILEHSGEGVDALVDFIEPPPPPAKRDPNSAYTTNDGRTFLPGTGWVS